MSSCFISYAWESDDHRNWVISLATRLRAEGVEIRLDKWDLFPGADLPQFMETSIRESDYVLLVCTPIFAKKANAGTGGVGYEKSVVTGELFYANGNRGKFVPLLRSGKPIEALPSYLQAKVFVDFRAESNFEKSLCELLEHVRGEGPAARSSTIANSAPVESLLPAPKSEAIIYCNRCGAQPGSQSICTGVYTAHSFTAGSTNDFCSRCGAKPGIQSVCTGMYTNHAFAAASANVYCERCGAKAGTQSICTGMYTNHSFVSLPLPN